jgi:integrase
MKEARLMRMVDTYLKGREGSTMRSYQSSYKKLVEICRKCGISVFGLTEEARCEIWLEAREDRLSVGSVRGISAVISLLKEVMGEEDACSGRERILKRALAKESNLVKKKRKRKTGTMGDVESLVMEAERSNKNEDWVIAALAVVCYFGCRRLADVMRIKVGDVTWEGGKITLFMKKQKTDILNEGDSFTMAVGGKGFAIKEFLVRYMDKLELGRKDVLFPGSFQRKSRDVSVTYAVAYHGLEDLKERLGLDSSLKWHSFRIGSATKGNMLGVRRSVVKGAGNWKSSAVDGYCREEDPGVVLSQELADCLG